MLVLSRKLSERIRIGDNIVIQIIRIGPGTVRIGIDAPHDVTISREELLNGSAAYPSINSECPAVESLSDLRTDRDREDTKCKDGTEPCNHVN